MFQMELDQFERTAGETLPEQVILVRGRNRHDPARELWAVVANRTLRLQLFPHLECRIAELWPVLFFDRAQQQLDERLTLDLGFSRVNRFFLVADLKLGKCRFGPPQGRMALDQAWRSYGLGSYLLAQLIAWGVERYPQSAITTEHFDLGSADVERPSLNGLCRRAGFDIIFHAPSGVTCCAKRMELLHSVYNQERVSEELQASPGDWFAPTFLGAKVVELVRARCLG